jgi:hypothetical protein
MKEGHSITGRPLLTARYKLPAAQEKVIPLIAPPLVSEDLWEEVQRRLALNRTHQGGNPKRARMLSGRAFCPCGHTALYKTPTAAVRPTTDAA